MIFSYTYTTMNALATEPSAVHRHHMYAGSRHIGNAYNDGMATTYGASWRWAGAQQEHAAPLKSLNPDTAGQAGYNVADAQSPQKETWLNPATTGDVKHLFGQGRPMAWQASGAGANYAYGKASQDGTATANMESWLMFDGTMVDSGAVNDLSRITDAREKGRIGIFGNALSYAGSYGRVTSESIGRDLNPLGRGDGNAYVAGGMNLGQIAPSLPRNLSPGGWGNSVNNGCGGDANAALSVPPIKSLSDSGIGDSAPSFSWRKIGHGRDCSMVHSKPHEAVSASECCPFECECGCSYSGSAGCCHHADPDKVKVGGDMCLISSSSPSNVVSVLSAAINRDYTMSASNIILNTNTGRPTGLSKGFSESDKKLEDPYGILQSICTTYLNSGCIPEDLKECFTNICTNPKARIIFKHECKGTEKVVPASTTCTPLRHATIHFCMDAIDYWYPSDDSERRLRRIKYYLLHELFHAALCCRTGTGNGCYTGKLQGKYGGEYGYEIAVDSCTRQCMMQQDENFDIESQYSASGIECPCAPVAPGRSLCMSEILSSCYGGKESERCQESTGKY